MRDWYCKATLIHLLSQNVREKKSLTNLLISPLWPKIPGEICSASYRPKHQEQPQDAFNNAEFFVEDVADPMDGATASIIICCLSQSCFACVHSSDRHLTNDVGGCILDRGSIPKHCQRHNGPEGWVLLNKVYTQILIEFYLQNLDQASTSKSKPKINISTLT